MRPQKSCDGPQGARWLGHYTAISSLSLSLSLCVSCHCHHQKMYGLYGLKHHKVEKSLDVTIVTHRQRTESEDRARILRGRIRNYRTGLR